MAIEYREIQSKTVLNKHKFVNPWGWNRYTVHAYIGCQHRCEYCYERYDKYYGFQDPEDFSTVIKIKTNAPEVLARQIARARRDVIALDKYQPVESKYRLNRKLLEIIRDHNFPCFILEKSGILLRDIDILKEIDKNAMCSAAYSISMLERNLYEIFEPGAPSPDRRLDAVKQLTDKGITAGVFLLPVLPYIGDDDETLDKTIQRIKEAGAQYVLVGSLTLSLHHKDRFIQLLNKYFPELTNKYLELYRNGQAPDPAYLSGFAARASRICREHRIDDYVPRLFVPEGMPKKNFEVSTMLFHIAHLLEGKGESSYRYYNYIKAAQAVEAMSENIEVLAKMGKIPEIPNVGQKIAAMIIETLDTGKCVFYEELKRETLDE